MVQLLVSCGGPVGTLAVECGLEESVGVLKQRLHARSLHVGPPDTQVLVHRGRCLHDARQLGSYSLVPGASLHLTGRLLGGGGDGGSTGAESRSCYLEMYLERKPDKVNPAEEQLAKFTQCHLSGQTLSPPCVVDELGNLFNKDALVQALLNKTLPPSLAYITGLKSVVELKLAPNPFKSSAAPRAAGRGSYQPANNETDFCCPVTGVQFNGRFRFLVHRRSGHVLSEKALKEVPPVVEELVGGPWSAEDWIPVNPQGEQLDEMRHKLAAKMAAERQEKARKKAAKSAAKGAAAGVNGEANGGANGAAVQGENGSAGPSSNGKDSSSGVHNGAAAGNGLHQEVGKKRASSPGVGLPAAAEAGAANGAQHQQHEQPPAKKVKKPAPSHQSAVYKSLFTSSLPQQEKETFCCRSVGMRGVHLS